LPRRVHRTIYRWLLACYCYILTYRRNVCGLLLFAGMILLITVIGGICDIVSLCVTALLEENGLSYQQKLGSHILYGRRSAEGQEVEGQGHMVVKIVTVACCW